MLINKKKVNLEAIQITKKGIKRIEKHLTRTPRIEPGTAEFKMLERIKAGNRTSPDMRFYQHELIESRVIKKTSKFYSDPVDAARAAHHKTLVKKGFYRRGYEKELYHPDALKLFGE